MKVKEIMETASAGATAAGAIAPVMDGLGTVSRNGGSLLSGKYVTGSDPTPNTPKEYKRKQRASGQFKNSIGN
jgi:hypothetical protein